MISRKISPCFTLLFSFQAALKTFFSIALTGKFDHLTMIGNGCANDHTVNQKIVCLQTNFNSTSFHVFQSFCEEKLLM